MSKQKNHTICVPAVMSDKLNRAYTSLTNIDSNFSRLIQCTLDSIIKVAAFIYKQKKNFRHYNWHLIIQDKETGHCFSTCDLKELKK